MSIPDIVTLTVPNHSETLETTAAVSSLIEQVQTQFDTGDPVVLQQLAWQALEKLRQQQASARPASYESGGAGILSNCRS
jgi:hypothetical protein